MEALIHSFIHSGHFYSAPSSPLPLRGAPDYNTDTVSEFHAEVHRQLQVKDLPKVPAWRLELLCLSPPGFPLETEVPPLQTLFPWLTWFYFFSLVS